MDFLFKFLRGFYIVFKKAFEKKVTIRYPQQKNIKSSKFRGSHKFTSELCIKCQCCVRSCPSNCIIVDENNFIIDYKKCCFCGNCVRACKRNAIKMDSSDVTPTLKKESLLINFMEKL